MRMGDGDTRESTEASNQIDGRIVDQGDAIPAAVKLPVSTTWIRTWSWSSVGVPGPAGIFDKLE